ncbi:hypothetical protein DV515_00011410 [Chloebia gouldiae]|uniref:Uncharacterized protein n=1 Tax=Chloebia gouldiae TaxID=44316 RepID=A0A3L8S7Q7_CHLGU|nr:hypothetical protein DV515_00011410 [Chloebia gouldiae]
MPCEPGWEQSAAPPYKPPEGTYLKMLESSCMQSPEQYETATSVALFTTHSTEQPVPFGTEAVMEPGTYFGSPVLLPGEAVSSAAASPWQGNFVLHSYESLPSVNYWLPMWWTPYGTGGVSGSVWTPGTVFGSPQCPPVSVPCVEESQALGQSQVLEDPAVDSLTNDMFQAACLLCEFSDSGRM